MNTNTLIKGVDGGSGDSWAGFGNGLTTSSWDITRVQFHNPGTVAGNTYTYRAMLGRWTTGTQYLNYAGYNNSSIITIEEISQ